MAGFGYLPQTTILIKKDHSAGQYSTEPLQFCSGKGRQKHWTDLFVFS